MARLPRVGNVAESDDLLGELGCVIVEQALSAEEVEELRSAIDSLEAGHPHGRNDFEGRRSHRLYSLIARGPAFERIAEHPVALHVLDARLQPNWLLSNCQSIRLYPGETHQPWHTDDGFYDVPRPRPCHPAPS